MKHWMTVAAVASLVAACVIGCQTQQSEAQAPAQQVATPGTDEAEEAWTNPLVAYLDEFELTDVQPEDTPRLNGSTSCQPLHMTVVCDAFDLEPLRVLSPFGIGFSASDTTTCTVLPEAPAPGSAGPNPDAAWLLRSAQQPFGTHQAYMHLIDGSFSLVFEARKPIEIELEAAREAGVELEVTPIAMDAFVFLLNRENPLEGLTLEQIRRIYTGEIAQWSEVGGAEQKIKAYTRNETSGSQGLMRELVIGDDEMIEGDDMMASTMMGPVNSLAGDPWGIGYSVHYYMAFMAPMHSIRLAEIDGVAPTSETIRSGEYPLCSEVYAVIRADEAEESPARKLRDWLLTEYGQRVIAESGYVPIAETQDG